ncbi:MAG: polysaccharide deacetylase family protein, partial [Candidatus Poseidoniales archaeon]
RLPPKAFAITFDDGFENNLTVAAPILSKHKIPATIYITTDFIESNRMSWIDRIEFVVEQVEQANGSLPWGEFSFKTTKERRSFLEDIRHHLKSKKSIDGDLLATKIQNFLGFDEIWSSDHPLDRKMTWNQVRDLSSIPGMTIGGHTHTHAIMSYLDDTELKTEIDTSLSLISKRCNYANIVHYAYPEGLAHHYNEKVIETLKSRGIQCCPSAIHGVNAADTDLFNLRRVMTV